MNTLLINLLEDHYAIVLAHTRVIVKVRATDGSEEVIAHTLQAVEGWLKVHHMEDSRMDHLVSEGWL